MHSATSPVEKTSGGLFYEARCQQAPIHLLTRLCADVARPGSFCASSWHRYYATIQKDRIRERKVTFSRPEGCGCSAIDFDAERKGVCQAATTISCEENIENIHLSTRSYREGIENVSAQLD